MPSWILPLVLASAIASPSHDAWIGGGRTVSVDDARFEAVVMVCANHGCCTGTFLNDSTLLTAGHCIGHAADGTPNLRFGKVEAKRIFENPTALMYRRQAMAWEGLTEHDGAIAVFPPNTAPPAARGEYPRIAESEPRAGDGVTLVGFGVNDLVTRKGAGVKRWGTNKVEWVGYEISFPGLSVPSGGDVGGEAGSLPGDSGGPLLNAAGEIVGLASRITYYKNSARLRAYYTNVKNRTHLSLFRDAIRCEYGTLCAKNFPNSGVAADEPPIPAPRPKLETMCLTPDDQARLAATVRAGKDPETLLSRAKHVGACDDLPPVGATGCLSARELTERLRLGQLDYEEGLLEAEEARFALLTARAAASGVCP